MRYQVNTSDVLGASSLTGIVGPVIPGIGGAIFGVITGLPYAVPSAAGGGEKLKMKRKVRARTAAGVVFSIVLIAVFLGWLAWTLYIAPDSNGLESSGINTWPSVVAFWTIMVSLPLLFLNALLAGVWGCIRVHKLRRRFPDALVFQTPLPFNSSFFAGVLLPGFIPRLTMGCTVVAREEALEIWWGLFARRCGQLRWSDIDAISAGQTVSQGNNPKVLHWIGITSPVLPTELKVAVTESVWLAHPTAGKARVEKTIDALNLLREGKKIWADVNEPKNQARVMRNQLRARLLRTSFIWGPTILVLFIGWVSLALTEQKIGALVAWFLLLSLALGFCAQGLCAMIRARLLTRRGREEVVISILAPNIGFRLPGKIFPLGYNRATFGVNLAFDAQGVSFWQGLFVRRYGRVGWEQIDSVSLESAAPNLFGPQPIPTLVIKSSVWGGALSLPVVVSPWTFSGFASEAKLTEIIEQIEALRYE